MRPMASRSFPPRSIDGIAEELRRLDRLMEAGVGRRVMTRRGRRLFRRYQLLMLQAADMLAVAIPAQSQWESPHFRGALFGGHTEFVIEEALRAAGFDPFAWEEA